MAGRNNSSRSRAGKSTGSFNPLAGAKRGQAIASGKVSAKRMEESPTPGFKPAVKSGSTAKPTMAQRRSNRASRAAADPNGVSAAARDVKRQNMAKRAAKPTAPAKPKSSVAPKKSSSAVVQRKTTASGPAKPKKVMMDDLFGGKKVNNAKPSTVKKKKSTNRGYSNYKNLMDY